MKKIFFLFFLIPTLLPVWAQRANTVTMISTFPVQYMSYDELYAKTLKLGLDRNTQPMLKIRQEPLDASVYNTDPAQSGDFYALEQRANGSSAPAPAALQVNTTTVQSDVAFARVNEFSVPVKSNEDFTLGFPTSSDELAVARFGRAQLHVNNNTQNLTMGLGMRTLQLAGNSEGNAPPRLLALLAKLQDSCPTQKVPQWVKKTVNDHDIFYLGCGENRNYEAPGGGGHRTDEVLLTQWARKPYVRQVGVEEGEITGVWDLNGVNGVKDCNVCNDTLIVAIQRDDIKEGFPCDLRLGNSGPADCQWADATSGTCKIQRNCEIEDGCVRVDENGAPATQQVYEAWECSAPSIPE